MVAELSTALTGAMIALLGVVSATLAVLAVHVPRLVQAWLEARTEATRTQRAQRVERASDQAVAAAEELGRARGLRGEEKLSLATEVAQQLAPDTPPPPAAIQASVARLRASATSSSQLAPVQLPPGTALSLPVTVISSDPPPLPAPARVPREELPTNPDLRRPR